MSENSDEAEKAQQQSESSAAENNVSETKPKPARPRIGTPIGTPIGQSSPTQSVPQSQPSTTAPAQPQPAQPAPASRPTIGTPVGSRPRIGTPVGSPVVQPSSPLASPQAASEKQPASPAQPSARPSIGTPVSGRPTIGTPSTARPSVGTPTSGAGNVAVPGRPSVPPKAPVESKKDISRRNFLTALVVVGGALAIGGAGWFVPFIESSVGSVSASKQALLLANGTNMHTSDVLTSDGTSSIGALTDAEAANGGAWRTFTYPYTGNADIDDDTFKQCVIIRLPPSLNAPDIGAPYAVKDPLMSTYTISGLGDTLVAFSRVCVHLWCLWSYNPTYTTAEGEYTRRMQCPCHGSNYVPGTGSYSPPDYSPGFPAATNQPPGQAVAGPASLQVAPNNQLPIIQLDVDPDGTLYAYGIIGLVGCGQKC